MRFHLGFVALFLFCLLLMNSKEPIARAEETQDSCIHDVSLFIRTYFGSPRYSLDYYQTWDPAHDCYRSHLKVSHNANISEEIDEVISVNFSKQEGSQIARDLEYAFRLTGVPLFPPAGEKWAYWGRSDLIRFRFNENTIVFTSEMEKKYMGFEKCYPGIACFKEHFPYTYVGKVFVKHGLKFAEPEK